MYIRGSPACAHAPIVQKYVYTRASDALLALSMCDQKLYIRQSCTVHLILLMRSVLVYLFRPLHHVRKPISTFVRVVKWSGSRELSLDLGKWTCWVMDALRWIPVNWPLLWLAVVFHEKSWPPACFLSTYLDSLAAAACWILAVHRRAHMPARV